MSLEVLANCPTGTVESEVPVLSPALPHQLLGPFGKHVAVGLGRYDKKCAGCASVKHEAALATKQGSLLEALGYSLAWFDKPSSQEYFPMGEVAHAQARASVYAFRSLVVKGGGESQLADRLKSEFDFYSSVGGDGRGKRERYGQQKRRADEQ